MDPAMRRNVWTLINELKKQGMTIILTTHYLDEAEKLCDRVCFLNRGVIEFIDTPANLLKKTQEASLEDVWLKLAEDTIKDGNC
jgi:ABC-2 type transport system ATP-binding protein